MNTDDIVAIQQLIVLYDHFFDQIGSANRKIGRAFLVSDVMTDDCVFEYGGTRLVGSAAIEAAHVLPEGVVASHGTTNIFVYEQDGETRVHAKFVMPDQQNGGMQTGDLHFVVIKTPAGWRISKKSSALRFRASAMAPAKA
jgi:hypothetical protein